jgi:hypothetical protein
MTRHGFDEMTEVNIAPTATGLSEARRIHLLIEGSLETAWEHLREEAEETLKLSPDDAEAQGTLRDYQEYRRKQALPEAKRVGLILTKPKTGRQRGAALSKTGQWVRDRKYGWLVRSAGQVGDVVPVRRRDGTEEEVKLVERVMPGLNFFKGRTL